MLFLNQRIELKSQLILHEDIKLKPYKCTAGKVTIGVGRNLDDKGISRPEALYMLENDIDECIDDLDTNFPWFADISDVRKRVLIDMRFNLGMDGLRGFPKFLAACARGDWETAALEMEDSLWWDQVGTRARRLQHFMRFNNTDFYEVRS